MIIISPQQTISVSQKSEGTPTSNQIVLQADTMTEIIPADPTATKDRVVKAIRNFSSTETLRIALGRNITYATDFDYELKPLETLVDLNFGSYKITAESEGTCPLLVTYSKYI